MGCGSGILGRVCGAALLCSAVALLPACDDRSTQNLYLYAPLGSTTTYLVDAAGRPTYAWPSRYEPGQSAFLQADGSLVRAGAINAIAPTNRFVEAWADADVPVGFNVGGIVERIDEDGEVRWSITYYGDTFAQHHDVVVLPNGDLLMPVWRYDTVQEAIAKGRAPSLLTAGGLWLDSVAELRVRGASDFDVVWEWRTSDHLVQDIDPTKENYGSVVGNPQLIDVNHQSTSLGMPPEDLMHSNSVVYVPELDQIIVTVFNYSELWVIDHSTTTAEAASHAGGRYGHGGDLLYRWGNPSAYGHSGVAAFNLSGVHDANWIADQRRFAMFDNDNPDPSRDLPGGSSKLVVIEPPLREDGSYAIGPDGVFGPAAPLLAADLGFMETVIGTAIQLPDGSYSSCDCMAGDAVLLDREGAVTDTIEVWSSTVGEPMPSFRITPYAPTFAGVRALDGAHAGAP